MEIYSKYSEKYFILDFDHLFVSTTICDEAIIFGGKQSSSLVNETKKILLSEYSINLNENQNLSEYSGGQRVIISLIFYMLVFKVKMIKPPQLLLINIIESLSEENHKAILNTYEDNKIDISYHLLDSNNYLIKTPHV